MYAQFFGLREPPFNNTPDPRFFFSTPDHEEALALLIYAVSERKEFALLTGEIGAGKTLVSRMMLRHFGARIAYATINHAVRSHTDLVELVCMEFGLESRDARSHAQRLRSLHDFLLAQFAKNVPVVLVLDEAQNLPTDAFEQLRMVGNLEADDAKLLQTIIVGQPELQRIFASPQLRQLRQRIFRSFHLPALSRELTAKYIQHRVTVAGGAGHSIFDADAIDAVFAASGGIPRVVNTLCDNGLLSAYSADRATIDGPFMHGVIAQLSPRTEVRATPAYGFRPVEPVEAPGIGAPPPSAPAPERVTPLGAVRPAAPRTGIAPVAGAATTESGFTDRIGAIEREVAKLAVGERESRDDLARLITHAKGMLSRVDAVHSELRRRESEWNELLANGRAMIGDMRSALDQTRRTAVEAQRAGRAAQTAARAIQQDVVLIREQGPLASPRVPVAVSPTVRADDPIAGALRSAGSDSALISCPSRSDDVAPPKASPPTASTRLAREVDMLLALVQTAGAR